MVGQVYKNLKTKEIVNEDYIEELRKHIIITYPKFSPKEAAQAFASVIRRAIDINITQFEVQYREEIKNTLIVNAVGKNLFVISGSDIFDVCCRLDADSESFIEAFTLWINDIQDEEIAKDSLIRFIERANQIYLNYTDKNVEEIIEILEYQQIPNLQINSNTAIHKVSKLPVKKKSYRIIVQVINAIILCYSILYSFLKTFSKNKDFKKYIAFASFCIIVISFMMYSKAGYLEVSRQNVQSKSISLITSDARYLNIESKIRHIKGINIITDELGEEYKYKEIDKNLIRAMLERRDSLLSKEPYLSTIINVSKKYNINPLLLFAITGQEQAFVPIGDKYSSKLANNPFNVFGSWLLYNTNISHSSEVAAKTIISSSKARPLYINSVRWINRKYAEDKNWWQGVYAIFIDLEVELTKQK